MALDPVSLALIGSSLIGGASSIIGGNRAADAQRDAAQVAAGQQTDALRTQLQLSRPGMEVGQSALSQLAGLFGLAQPTPLDFGAIERSAAPGVGNLTPIPGEGRFANSTFVDPSNGQVFVIAQQGGNAGQLVPINQRRPEFIQQQPQQAQGQAPLQNSSLLDIINNNPGIQFVRDQGEQAIARNAAARGLNQSGSTLQGLTEFNQGLASTNFQNLVLNPLFQLAGFGQQQTANAQNFVGGTANSLGNLALNAGSARASAFQNTGNVIGNTLSDLGQAAFLNNLVNRTNP